MNSRHNLFIICFTVSVKHPNNALSNSILRTIRITEMAKHVLTNNWTDIAQVQPLMQCRPIMKTNRIISEIALADPFEFSAIKTAANLRAVGFVFIALLAAIALALFLNGSARGTLRTMLTHVGSL